MSIKCDPRSCPMCGKPLHYTKARNSTSRFYTNLYICSQCGIDEAFDGKSARVFTTAEASTLIENQAVL